MTLGPCLAADDCKNDIELLKEEIIEFADHGHRPSKNIEISNNCKNNETLKKFQNAIRSINESYCCTSEPTLFYKDFIELLAVWEWSGLKDHITNNCEKAAEKRENDEINWNCDKLWQDAYDTIWAKKGNVTSKIDELTTHMAECQGDLNALKIIIENYKTVLAQVIDEKTPDSNILSKIKAKQSIVRPWTCSDMVDKYKKIAKYYESLYMAATGKATELADYPDEKYKSQYHDEVVALMNTQNNETAEVSENLNTETDGTETAVETVADEAPTTQEQVDAAMHMLLPAASVVKAAKDTPQIYNSGFVFMAKDRDLHNKRTLTTLAEACLEYARTSDEITNNDCLDFMTKVIDNL